MPGLVSYAFVTLANTKVFLGITNSDKDTLLEMLINIATDYIESQTGRRFVSTVNTYEKHDGNGKNTIQLKAYPIIIPPNVILEYNKANDNTDDLEVISADDYWVDTETGIITKITDFDSYADEIDFFISGKDRYRATYTSGYSTVPYDLQYACMSLVGQLLTMKSATGIKSESLGDHSITFQDVTDIGSQSMFSDILNKYREIPLA
jgi:hypothetical protein